MVENSNSLNRNKKTLRFCHILSASIIFMVALTLLFSYFVVSCNGLSLYTPATPSGVTAGDINVDYEYIIYTVEVGSFWMFDWGDGNYSEWIEVSESDTYISQTYNWGSYGIYEVRVKHQGIYSVVSQWSLPLIVTISLPVDKDEDGWENEIEIAYGKDPEDPNNYPLDTDGDGTPDDNSLDEEYIGDSDDDNDGLLDEYEESIGSNSKDESDVISIIIQDQTYYIVDTNENGKHETLFNPQTELKNKVLIENGVTYLDINGDGSWDYTYDGAVALYEPFPWLYLILGVISAVIIVIFILFKTGILFLYEEEYIVEE